MPEVKPENPIPCPRGRGEQRSAECGGYNDKCEKKGGEKQGQ